MGFFSKLREFFGAKIRAFDEQVEGHGYPADGARRPSPAPRPGVERERLRSADGVRGPLGNQGVAATPGPGGRRTPPPAPPRAPRHRLDETRRRHERDDVVDTDLTFGAAATLESATPHWMDEPGHHDHRHHGHSAAAEHPTESSAPTSAPDHGSHHGSHGHDYDYGSGDL
jgi:hypothetical protein